MDRLERFRRGILLKKLFALLPHFHTFNLFSIIDLAGQFYEGQDKEEMYADGNDKHNSGDDDQDDDSDDDKEDEDDTANVPESHQLSLWLS